MNSRTLRCYLLLIAACLMPVQANVLWQDFRLSYLHGKHYRVGDPQRQVITIEHAARTSWGDSFFFLDHMKYANGQHSNYAEWQPRYSLAKQGALSGSGTFIKDVLIAGHLEMSSLRTNLLYGLGLDLDVPGFKFVQLNLFRRSNENLVDNWQATLVWAVPFQLGGHAFLYDGFIDWASGSVEQHANVNWTSQLKWLASDLWQGKHQLWLGVEYVWWRHKFGIIDSPALPTHERNVNLLLKLHF